MLSNLHPAGLIKKSTRAINFQIGGQEISKREIWDKPGVIVCQDTTRRRDDKTPNAGSSVEAKKIGRSVLDRAREDEHFCSVNVELFFPLSIRYTCIYLEEEVEVSEEKKAVITDTTVEFYIV